MKLRIAMTIVGVFVFSVALVAAQDDAKKTTHKKVRTVSGCLQKTDDANEYKLTTAKGGTWEIKSDAVPLGEHVGHTVSVMGVVSNATMHGAKEDSTPSSRGGSMHGCHCSSSAWASQNHFLHVMQCTVAGYVQAS